MVVPLRIETEIAAAPAEVRDIVLDFARYPEWHTSFIQRIACNSSTLPPGSTLDAKVGGLNFVPIVKVNTQNEFSWHGSVLGGAFAGVHIIQFLESQITPEGTTLVHGEDYDGWMTWLFGEGMMGLGRKSAMKMFAGYNIDVKNRVEVLKKQKTESANAESETTAKL